MTGGQQNPRQLALNERSSAGIVSVLTVYMNRFRPPKTPPENGVRATVRTGKLRPGAVRVAQGKAGLGFQCRGSASRGHTLNSWSALPPPAAL